eukprot:1718026-Alexandrium_andersonii.AAC.1
MGPRGDREDGPGERLSHSQDMEEVAAELERFRFRWWKEFTQWVAEQIKDDYNPDQWSGDIEWCDKGRMERRLKNFYRKH